MLMSEGQTCSVTVSEPHSGKSSVIRHNFSTWHLSRIKGYITGAHTLLSTVSIWDQSGGRAFAQRGRIFGKLR